MSFFTFKKNSSWLTLSIIFLTTLSISCVKEKDFNFDMMAQNQYESEWAVPLIHARYQLGDFVLDTMDFIQTDPTNQFITVIYNTGDIWSVSAEDIFTLPDENINNTQNIPAPSSTPPTPWETTYSTQIDLAMNSYTLDTLSLKGGSFITAINTNINHPAEVTVTIPGAVDQNGSPLSFITDMTDLSGSGTASGSTTINLTGYKFTMETGNKLTVNYKIKVLNDGNPFNIPTYNININTQLKDLKYKYMIGYFGQQTQNLIDTASIRLFSDHFDNSLYLKEFRAHLYMKNSFGIPLQFRVNNYTIYNSNQTINVITPGYTVDGPYPTLAQFGQTMTKHDTAFLNPSMLEISPKYQAFNATGTLNPNNDPSIKNFVRDDSKFSIDARLELPMEGRISKLSYRDTLEFQFKGIEAIDYINFKLYIENAFPIDGLIQVYFADSNYKRIDSLVTNPSENIFNSATVGPAPNLYTISNGISSKNFIVTQDRITRIANTKWLIIEAKLTSKPTGQFIKLYGNQYVSVALGTRVKIKTNY